MEGNIWHEQITWLQVEARRDSSAGGAVWGGIRGLRAVGESSSGLEVDTGEGPMARS
jgi:hypothetical protein